MTRNLLCFSEMFGSGCLFPLTTKDHRVSWVAMCDVGVPPNEASLKRTLWDVSSEKKLHKILCFLNLYYLKKGSCDFVPVIMSSEFSEVTDDLKIDLSFTSLHVTVLSNTYMPAGLWLCG